MCRQNTTNKLRTRRQFAGPRAKAAAFDQSDYLRNWGVTASVAVNWLVGRVACLYNNVTLYPVEIRSNAIQRQLVQISVNNASAARTSTLNR